MKITKIVIGAFLIFCGIISFFINPLDFHLTYFKELFYPEYWATNGAIAIGNILAKVVFLVPGYILIRNSFRK